jgi:hypothetical protein
MLSIGEIEQKIKQLANQIHAPDDLLPTFGYSNYDGTPHIEVNNVAYYYIVIERSIKITDLQTFELDTLLYWVFDSITFSMAVRYELAHRVPKTNHRREIFKHQLFLLETLNHDWKERTEKEIAETLKAYPD